MSDPVPPPARRPTETARLDIARLGGPLPEVIRRTCEIAADALTVERMGVWVFVDNRTALRCVNQYERTPGEHAEGTTLRVADFPGYFAAVSDRRALAVADAGTDPRAAELLDPYLRPLGITAFLDAPILLNGEVAGVVCHDHVGPPREWTTEEFDFAGSVADQLAVKMEGAELSEVRAAMRTQESRLFAFEKAEAMARIAVGVAHDFRNLLTVVLGNAGLIAGRADVPAEVAGFAKQILAAAERGSGLVKELLDFGRAGGAAPKVVDAAAVAADFAPILKAAVGSHHRIDLVRGAYPGKVLIDPNHLDRILLNLVGNARDAMPEGGRIRVKVGPVTAAEDRGGTEKPFVLVEVKDEGVGMDDDTRRRLFEPFFTTKKKGTGLGMAIVKRMTELAGGFLRVESAPGAGTRVRVFLPRVTGTDLTMPTLSAALGTPKGR